MGITATIITLNEEKNIRDCIVSLQSVCDEIIVVDSISKDKTVEIAEELGAKVYIQKYLGDGPQKHFGVQYASNEWILSMDADERLEPDAIEAIKQLDLENSSYDAYAFRRRNYVGKHWIKAAGFYPDSVVRLYNRNRAAYSPKKGHSFVEAKSVQNITAHISHFTYENYTNWVERLNQLSSRDAWAMYENKKKVGEFSPVLHAAVALIRKLILKGGIFQGRDGFTVAFTSVFRTYMKYLKLIELYENEKKD